MSAMFLKPMRPHIVSSSGSLDSTTSIGDQLDTTHLHHLQLFQPFLYKLLYAPLVAFVLVFMESVLRSPSSIFSEVVVCKLRRLP